MRDLLLAVPSRSRPQNINRLVQGMDATCRGDTWLVVGLDEDDPSLGSYLSLFCTEDERDVEMMVKPDLHQVVAWMNELIVPRRNDYKYVGSIGDDNTLNTEGWDVRIMEALERQPFAFGNDLYPTRTPGSLSCHIFMRSEVVRKLGYFGPPSIRHMYVDVAWYAWGVACGIEYLGDVILEHLHYTTGKSPMDASNQASLACTGPDLAAWHAYSRDGRLNSDIRKLGGTEFTPERLHQFNRDLNIPE